MAKLPAAFLLVLVAALVVALAPLAAAPAKDHAASAWTILPPGENGSLGFNANTTDQAKMYDALTPLFGAVTSDVISRTFKPAHLGLAGEKPKKVVKPRPGLTIARDRFGVAHVTGNTQQDVMFGAGWVTAEDRGLLLQLIRAPARVAALDVPGLDPLALALSGRSFVPSAAAEAQLASQIAALRKTGPIGEHLYGIARAYAAGVNAYYKANSIQVAPFTLNDIIASTALIAARFGTNGGQEAANGEFLSALRARLGPVEGKRVFDDLREANDPEAPVSVPGSFPYELPSAPAPGSVALDDGSFSGASFPRLQPASNALLVGANRSTSGHPLFVAGPQVTYFFPELFAEMDLVGGGYEVRGVVFPGLPAVVIGRGADFAWSITSSQADSRDLFVERLCGGDDRHTLYKGQCVAMKHFVAGTLRSVAGPDVDVAYDETPHGPVVGYATVAGERVAIAQRRSTRGREMLSLRYLWELDTGRVRSARDFVRTVSGIEFSFDFLYADDRDIAFYSTGRLPLRAPATDPALPTIGTGEYDWRGFLSAAKHAQAISPRSGFILNWNNKPAANVGSGDSNFAYGSVHRNDLLEAALKGPKKHTLVSVTAAMNKAATQDLRVLHVWPVIRAVVRAGVAPSTRAEEAARLLDAWYLAGGSRLDRDLDGKVDAPGAAVMDAAWPLLADAVLSPVLGPLVDRLARLQGRSNDAGPSGTSYQSGWYGYVDKDLRAILGLPVAGRFSRTYCGAGDIAACRVSLWAALDTAAARLEAQHGTVPDSWLADATGERIRFTSGILTDTMRWTNRPTFQQLMEFRTHRPR